MISAGGIRKQRRGIEAGVGWGQIVILNSPWFHELSCKILKWNSRMEFWILGEEDGQ